MLAKITLNDLGLMEIPEVKQWAEACEQKLNEKLLGHSFELAVYGVSKTLAVHDEERETIRRR